MIVADFFAGKNIVVVGLGKSGVGAVKSLVLAKSNVWIVDDSEDQLKLVKEQIPEVNIGELSEIKWSAIDYIVMSPGIPIIGDNTHALAKLANNHSIRIISDIDILYTACPDARYVGITGTNGKSTTTALVGHILQNACFKAQVGGNIGLSVLELEPMGQDCIYVIELSSFQLDITHDARFDVAALINITPDHLDRHLTMENYVHAKANLFGMLKDGGAAVISKDYDHTRSIAHDINTNTKCTMFSIHQDADITNIGGILSNNGIQFDVNGLDNLRGDHNKENIAAAYGICISLGVTPQDIIAGIKTFRSLPHRMEQFYEYEDLIFVNDSKATNADSTEKALLCFEDIYLILGGKQKPEGIKSILSLIKSRVKAVLLIGAAQDNFANDLQSFDITFKKVGTIDAALNVIRHGSNKSGVVLLSPACASFDQFKSFEHRGDEFKRLVKEIFAK